MSEAHDPYARAVASLNDGKLYREWRREQDRLALMRAFAALRNHYREPSNA